MYFLIWSPTAFEWQQTISIAQDELLNPKEAMTKLLNKVREDVDNQFDENQGKWTRLAKFTVQRKAELKADSRILHETNSSWAGQDGKSLRLRDAYAKTGYVTPEGVLIYTYPVEKPYAKEHQHGVGGTKFSAPRRSNRTWSNARERQQLQRELDRLDALFDRLFD